MRTLGLLALVGLWLTAAAPDAVRAQIRDPLARREVSRPGETTADARARAQAALATSGMQITVSAVGFDIRPGSEADKYLQGTARAGGGAYVLAADADQLIAAMGAVATGQAGIAGATPTGPDAVVITSPRTGDVVGPSIEVVGKTAPNVLVVLYTIAYPEVGEEQPKMIPGIRHRATDTGDFKFRIATPRISFGDPDVRIRYELRAHLLHADQSKGPETVLTLYSPKP